MPDKHEETPNYLPNSRLKHKNNTIFDSNHQTMIHYDINESKFIPKCHRLVKNSFKHDLKPAKIVKWLD